LVVLSRILCAIHGIAAVEFQDDDAVAERDAQTHEKIAANAAASGHGGNTAADEAASNHDVSDMDTVQQVESDDSDCDEIDDDTETVVLDPASLSGTTMMNATCTDSTVPIDASFLQSGRGLVSEPRFSEIHTGAGIPNWINRWRPGLSLEDLEQDWRDGHHNESPLNLRTLSTFSLTAAG